MNKTEIINAIGKQHSRFSEYISGLSEDEFLFRYQSKWSAGQQLKHIILCVQPLVQVCGMPNTRIEQKFGANETESRGYDKILGDYLEKLDRGGKSPKQYVSDSVLGNEKPELLETLLKSIQKLNKEIEAFSEKELDGLCIPHPVLGNITLREMLFNAIYHVQHHQIQTENNLKKMQSSENKTTVNIITKT